MRVTPSPCGLLLHLVRNDDCTKVGAMEAVRSGGATMHSRSTWSAALLAAWCGMLGWPCAETALAQDAGSWPTKAWETSLPEQQGMDSAALAELVKFGATEKMDSLL